MGSAIAACVLLGACGPHEQAAIEATQVLARVNGREITVHQVNYLLENPSASTMPGGSGARGDARGALDQLVAQELLVQAAMDRRLDREPNVLSALEAARREVLARAYLARADAAAGQPSPAEVADFYAGNPALFTERRIYTLRQLRFNLDAPAGAARAAPEEAPELEARLRSAWDRSHRWESLVEAAQEGGAHAIGSTEIVPAERLPLDQLAEFQRLGEGAVRISREDNRLLAQQVVRIEREPMSLETARPMIATYLAMQRRERAEQTELGRLRAAAKIEFVGRLPSNTNETSPQASPSTK